MKLSKRTQRSMGSRTPGLLIELGLTGHYIRIKSGGSKQGCFWIRNAHRLYDIAEEARTRFRQRLKWVHPDKGGSHQEAARLLTVWGKLKRSFLRHGIALSLVLAATVQAVTFAWDPNPPGDGVAYYRLYVGTNSNSYLTNFNAGTGTNFSIANTNLFMGRTNYFALVAVDATSLESDFSNEVTYRVPPGKARGFKLSLEGSGDPSGPWIELVAMDYADYENAETRFYRGRVIAE